MIQLHTTKSRDKFAAIVLSLIIFSLPLSEANAQQRRAGENRRPPIANNPSSDTTLTQTSRPRLVLLIVVDQFRYDYLERFGDLFAPNGLRMMLSNGASWTNTNYDHTPTYTAPGHATLMTGTWPSENGIVANEWFDRESGKNVTSVSDEGGITLGGEGERAASPRRLTASTVGDELRLATNNRAKVIGISVKDRSAILPAGRNASAAYWFSTRTGRMVSSNYYFNALPSWVARFNDAKPADKFFGQVWERLLPQSEYLRRAGADAPAWEEIGTTKDTKTFPHTITGGSGKPDAGFYTALDYSPFSNDLLVSFAKQAVENENLGADDDTDVLAVSFSANDYVGHRFGPYSHEAMDVTLRVDRQIGELLDFINRRVGLDNTVVAFTADHGVAPIPEHAAALNLPGGRIKAADVLAAMRAGIRARYNRPNSSADTTVDYISAFTNDNVYFNTAALHRDRINREEIERVVGEAAMTVPGITRYFTRTALENFTSSAADPLARRVLHGFNPRRSGDLVVIHEPFKYLLDYSIPATHGSPYSYDTHVPLIIMGRNFKRGTYRDAATPADLAPTLATVLRLQSPSNVTGRTLVEGLN